MDYRTLDDLNDAFASGQHELTDKFTINSVRFLHRSSTTVPFDDLIRGNKNAMIVYSAPGKEEKGKARAAGLKEWVVLVWRADNSTIRPARAFTTTAARAAAQMGIPTAINSVGDKDIKNNRSTVVTRSMGEAVDQNANPNTIGDTADVKITNLPSSKPMRGKVDTGATISSLHAEKWKINNDQVSFVCPELSPNVITVPMIDQIAVKSADGGVEYRPVIELNIKINDKPMQDIQFNLNDRGQMEFPILIGQNILEKGRFLIDPTMEGVEDDVDWDALNEIVNEMTFDFGAVVGGSEEENDVDPEEPVGAGGAEEVKNHMHTISQVQGLQEELDAIRSKLDNK